MRALPVQLLYQMSIFLVQKFLYPTNLWCMGQLPKSHHSLIYLDSFVLQVREAYILFQIMGGCPWVAPRPLFVLTVGQRESDDPLTYTLPTRVRRNDTAEELSKVVKLICFSDQDLTTSSLCEDYYFLQLIISQTDSFLVLFCGDSEQKRNI